jgi:acyl carrier protein
VREISYGEGEEELRRRIREIVKIMAPETPESITSDDRLVNDLGFHSLALIELAFALEDEFDLDAIDETTDSGIVTVGDIEDHVTARLRAVRVNDAS